MKASASTQKIINKALNLIIKENPAFYDNSSKVMSSSQITKDFFQLRLSGLEHEVFEVAFLDNQHKLIAYEQMFRGTINAAAVYPREIAKRSLELNAAAVILAHNHPSGLNEASRADIDITKRIKGGLDLLDIRTLDHIIIGQGVYSFAESGTL